MLRVAAFLSLVFVASAHRAEHYGNPLELQLLDDEDEFQDLKEMLTVNSKIDTSDFQDTPLQNSEMAVVKAYNKLCSEKPLQVAKVSQDEQERDDLTKTAEGIRRTGKGKYFGEPLSPTEKLVVKTYNILRKGKPLQFAALKGKEWASAHVASLHRRMVEAGESSTNHHILRDAYYGAMQLQGVANDVGNYKQLTEKQVADAEHAFTQEANKLVLKSDFGNEVIDARTRLFYNAASAGLDVTLESVQKAITNFAPMLASAGYDTQLGLHQSNYGGYNSDKKK